MNHTDTESIQSLIITGYTTYFYIYSHDVNVPLLLSSFMYMMVNYREYL